MSPFESAPEYEHGLPESAGEDGVAERLSELEQELRQHYKIRTTLREQLDSAVANEQYELAARLRDRIHQRTNTSPSKEGE